MSWRSLVIAVSFIASGVSASAEQTCLLETPAPTRVQVVDRADILTPGQENDLNSRLAQFNKATSTQLLIVTVNDLCGYDKSEFTYTLGEKWGVGQKGKDNGVVIMVKPHGQQGNRHAFIATGYGVEGVVPDALAHRIVQQEMIPRFKQGDFYGGISAAAETVMGLTKGEFTADQYAQQSKGRPKNWIPFVVFFLIILVVFGSRISRTRRYATDNNLGFWAAWLLLSQSGRRHGGYYDDFRSGGGGFGGFGGGGGGFGGFGGGGFGGGGAGGSW